MDRACDRDGVDEREPLHAGALRNSGGRKVEGLNMTSGMR